MKHLSSKELLRRKITKMAIEDYFGERVHEVQFARILKWLLRGKVELAADEKSAALAIKVNLADEVYVNDLGTGRL